MVQIVSAYFGDEKSFRNITQSLLGKISGGGLDVTADEKLLPVFESAPQTKLSPRDEKGIRDDAVKACGGEADQHCIEMTLLRLQQEKLKEKEVQNVTETAIKGRRLTVNILDENGKLKKMVAPDGQKFKLDNVEGGVKADTSLFTLPTMDEMYSRAGTIVGIVFASFMYVFSIAAVYAIFMRQYETTGNDSFRMISYVLTVISVVLPYSGFVIILGYFGFKSFVNEYVGK